VLHRNIGVKKVEYDEIFLEKIIWRFEYVLFTFGENKMIK
jgi:hypothetical protein